MLVKDQTNSETETEESIKGLKQEMAPSDINVMSKSVMDDPLGALASAAIAAEASEASHSDESKGERSDVSKPTEESEKGKAASKEESDNHTTSTPTKEDRTAYVPPTISFRREHSPSHGTASSYPPPHPYHRPPTYPPPPPGAGPHPGQGWRHSGV